MKARLEVYARLKPFSSKHGPINYTTSEDGKTLRIFLPKLMKFGNINNNKDYVDFNFEAIFDQHCSQDNLFDRVAKKVVLSCLDGYNGTIFAYGQTGSGKTYSMSGGSTWQLRGIIPRIITVKKSIVKSDLGFWVCVMQKMFDEMEERTDVAYKLKISYMEIYNENAYDLLDKNNLEQPLDNWAKIGFFEDDFGNIHLKNLSVHECDSEEKGIDLLMMGNFIRSHCIFTVIIEGRPNDGGPMFVSKMHLVDLAGSERPSKTNLEGTTLSETKHINLSLTYLEQVIIALNEKNKGNRTHVPFRNSLMTTILRDSLGGNCKTLMLSTMSTDIENLEETLSNCRFTQRCARLENEIRRNEIQDLNQVVHKLAEENTFLAQELDDYKSKYEMALRELEESKMERESSFQRSVKESRETTRQDVNLPPMPSSKREEEEEEKEVTPELIQKFKTKVDDFLNNKLDELEVKDMFESKLCFEILRAIYNERISEYMNDLNTISKKLERYDSFIGSKMTNKINEISYQIESDSQANSIHTSPSRNK